MYVYLKEPHPKRNKFIYTSARILDTEVGRNGLVNKVQLKVAGFTEPVKRHVSALAMLELDFITLQNESSEQVPVQDFIKNVFMKNTESTQNIGHISEHSQENLAHQLIPRENFNERGPYSGQVYLSGDNFDPFALRSAQMGPGKNPVQLRVANFGLGNNEQVASSFLAEVVKKSGLTASGPQKRKSYMD